MRLFFASLTYLVCGVCFCHAQVTVDCIVQNGNGEPLGYATAYYSNNESGVAANAEGLLSIEVEKTSDTLRFSMLGYETRDIPVSEVLRLKTVILEPHDYVIREIVVTDENRFVPLLGGKTLMAVLCGRPGSIMLVKVNNPTFSGKLISKLIAEKRPEKELSPKKKNKKEKPEPSTCALRCRIFAIGEDGLPAYDLLTVNIIADNIPSSETIEADLSPYNIEVPPAGLFVGFEWLPMEQSYSSDIYSLPAIKMTADDKEPKTVFGSMNGKWEWFILTKEDDIPFFVSKKIRNAKIGIEVN